MRTIEVNDSFMAYTETGAGVPVVFLHGNPTSSYLWRKVIPHVQGQARALAPDLIGMGESGKPDIGYRFTDHAGYLDAWFEKLGLDDVVIVGHDWGGALGMHYAARNPGKVRGIALVETFLRSLTWAEYPPNGAALFRAIRSPQGEQMVLRDNSFIEVNLPAGVLGGLSPEDHDVYRRPYPDPRSRLPTLVWPREIPIDGAPADVDQIIVNYTEWAKNSPGVPKLLMTVEPGTAMGSADAAVWAKETYASLEVVSVGPGGHHAPEDQPHAIGQAVARWLTRHKLTMQQ
ncbi:haloalkane dehalogenase [Kibdelosporangium banguiense]|uniref:Haloalkane dehalogenase n=1 Tax=Kibdelosporangium banguiense TaxID=1365924 RepID=A0ABS4TFE5_9PSEU|nr:haloalkane dehalogenase [Kibdelosporangium banguiense]MBP2322598.1 haloalkane dehalogenase [Kibdelosporangium banguiense]